MAKAILNNVLSSGNEVEAVRDGWYVKKPEGQLQITQNTLRAFNAAQDKMEKLAGLVRDGLQKGASVEDGSLDAGLYVERDYNYASAFLAAFEAKLASLNVDVAALKAEVKDKVGAKYSNPRLRVFDPANKDEKPKGERQSYPVAAPVLAPVESKPVEAAVA